MRPRGINNRGLPQYLYPKKAKVTNPDTGRKVTMTYYWYDNPKANIRVPLGTDKAEAVGVAIATNEKYGATPLTAAERIGNAIAQRRETNDTPIGVMADRYQAVRSGPYGNKKKKCRLGKQAIAESKGCVKKINERIGDSGINSIDLKFVVEFLDDEYSIETGTSRYSGGPHSRDKLKTHLKGVIDYAAEKGIFKKESNPLDKVKILGIESPRKPLNLRWYFKIIDHPMCPLYLRTLMQLMFLTLQRPGDLLHLKLPHKDATNFDLVQKKTGTPMEISIGKDLAEIFNESRQRNFISPFVVAKIPKSYNSYTKRNRLLATRLTLKTAEESFNAVRDLIPEIAALTKTERPTLYAAKGLGIFLYKQRDGQSPQTLAGHKHKSTTDSYAENHETFVWWQASPDLAISNRAMMIELSDRKSYKK